MSGELKALETMSGAYGSYVLTGATQYIPPLGLAIQALVASADTVIASAEDYEGGYVTAASEYTAMAVKAMVNIMFPAGKPLATITLTSGTVTLYYGRAPGTVKAANIATAAGLTTGAIPITSREIQVTSPSAASVICLPTTSASIVGLTISGWVGANGFELRPIAAQANTVYINGVTTGVEAAIPAQSTFRVRCIDATHWLLRTWDATGEERAAIVPDAV